MANVNTKQVKKLNSNSNPGDSILGAGKSNICWNSPAKIIVRKMKNNIDNMSILKTILIFVSSLDLFISKILLFGY